MFQALEDLEARRDDMVLVSYPRCATLTNHCCTHLINLFSLMVLFISKEMKQIPSPRILATHLNYDCLPKSVFKNKAKVDTAVSFFHFHNNVPGIPSYSSWDEFFSEFMNGKVSWGSCFDHAVTWNKHIEDENTMIVIYEDLEENLTASVKQIAEFFGVSPMAVKDKAQEIHGAVGSFLFRKGGGDWKNLFTEAQNREMDAKFKVCLEGTKLGAKLKYNVYCKV
uniref:Sulfotransferase n=1 Tax=Melopsittacus undulatus TaxID=13146 RepID=A0A8C6K4D7_MELUD